MRKIVRASYTVEATFVMPLVLGVIFIVINLAFYMYDYNVLNQYTCRIAQKYSLDMEHKPEEISSQLVSSDSKIRSLLIAQNVKFKADVTEKNIVVTCEATLNKPIGENLTLWNKKNAEKIKIRKKVSRNYPVEFIRKLKRVVD